VGLSNHILDVGLDHPQESSLLGDIRVLGNPQTFLRSILSVLFARGQHSSGGHSFGYAAGYQYCSNLLSLLQPSLIGHQRQLLALTSNHEVYTDDDGDSESELIWRAPPLLTLADIPWLVDDTVEPGVTLRCVISHLLLTQCANANAIYSIGICLATHA